MDSDFFGGTTNVSLVNPANGAHAFSGHHVNVGAFAGIPTTFIEFDFDPPVTSVEFDFATPSGIVLVMAFDLSKNPISDDTFIGTGTFTNQAGFTVKSGHVALSSLELPIGKVRVEAAGPAIEGIGLDNLEFTQLSPPFIRGDCNADGELNITDGITIIGFIFIGLTPPVCFDACDTDDDADVDASDAICAIVNSRLGSAVPGTNYEETP